MVSSFCAACKGNGFWLNQKTWRCTLTDHDAVQRLCLLEQVSQFTGICCHSVTKFNCRKCGVQAILLSMMVCFIHLSGSLPGVLHTFNMMTLRHRYPSALRRLGSSVEKHSSSMQVTSSSAISDFPVPLRSCGRSRPNKNFSSSSTSSAAGCPSARHLHILQHTEAPPQEDLYKR